LVVLSLPSRSDDFFQYSPPSDNPFADVWRLQGFRHAEREQWLQTKIRELHAPLLRRLRCVNGCDY
jgi:hypothetical protein